MLDFRIVSVLMAVFTSNMLIIILTMIFLSESILYKFGLSILSVFCVLIFVRMALPFEFAQVTINIKFPAIVSKMLTYLQHPRISLFRHTYSIWEFCIFIWGIGFLILFLRYIYYIKYTYSFIQNHGTDVTDEYVLLIEELCTKKKLQKRLRVINLSALSSPSVFMYGLHYYILIPKNLELENEEKQLILRHELSHIMHHDLILKFFVQILCLFYWWNLFCILLKKQSDLLFELRVDFSVISQGKDKIKQYLMCLLKIRQYNAENKSKLLRSTTISFLPKKRSTLYKRFYFIMANDTPKNKHLAKVVLIPVCILYIASFVFIFEAYYRRPENTDGELLTSANMYVVKDGENKYNIYFNGVYAETVSSLKNYPKNCKIYLSLKEAKENEKN